MKANGRTPYGSTGSFIIDAVIIFPGQSNGNPLWPWPCRLLSIMHQDLRKKGAAAPPTEATNKVAPAVPIGRYSRAWTNLCICSWSSRGAQREACAHCQRSFGRSHRVVSLLPTSLLTRDCPGRDSSFEGSVSSSEDCAVLWK